MNTYRFGTNVARVVFMILLILVLIVGGLIWFDFLGVIDFKQNLSVVTSLLGVQPQANIESDFSPTLLDSSRLEKERQAILIERRGIEQIMEDLKVREAELTQKESEVSEREKSVEERLNSLNEALSQYDNKVVNMEQTARYLMGMPPEDAVAIMEKYDEQDLVDLLRTSERLSQEDGNVSLVAYWLSIMSDRNQVAKIQRLLVEKPAMRLDE